MSTDITLNELMLTDTLMLTAALVIMAVFILAACIGVVLED